MSSNEEILAPDASRLDYDPVRLIRKDIEKVTKNLLGGVSKDEQASEFRSTSDAWFQVRE